MVVFIKDNRNTSKFIKIFCVIHLSLNIEFDINNLLFFAQDSD